MMLRLYKCREIARMLADDQKKRVVIVDTSNEIGGDGDVPHCGIGLARRMQVPNVNMQHNVSCELSILAFALCSLNLYQSSSAEYLFIWLCPSR